MYDFKEKIFELQEGQPLLNNFLKVLDFAVIGDYSQSILRIYDDFEDEISLAGDAIPTPELNDISLINTTKQKIELLLPIIKNGNIYLSSINENHKDYNWVLFITTTAKAELSLFEKIINKDISCYANGGGFDMSEIYATTKLYPY